MILIKNAAYVVVSADQVLRGADVRIDGARIDAVGENLPEEGCERVLNAAGKIVAPGFVNAHTHLYQNMLKGMGDRWRLKEWCEEVTFPFSNIIHKYERQLGDETLGYAYGLLGAVEMLRCGVTAFINMDNNLTTQLEAWEDLGIRGVLAVQSVNRWIPKELMIPDEKRLQQLEDTVARWHGRGLQDVYIAPSTPFTCTPSFLRDLQDLSRRRGVKIQTHVSETEWEVRQSLEEEGTTPLQYLENVGFLEEPILAVHCVHLTEDEMELCRRRNLTVCYNPKSNAKLGSGMAPIAELRDRGVKLCLATDGAASNDLLDPFEEMRFGAMVQKLRYGDPARFGEKDIYRMATEGGARAMGLDAGRIEKGKLADLILVDCTAPHMAPLHDPISAMVYCGKGEDVKTVIVNGRIVLEDGVVQTIREAEQVRAALALGEARLAEVTTGPMNSQF